MTDGAETLTEQDVAPVFHKHVTGLPVPQLSVRLTLVPAATAVLLVLGDWLMLQFPGAVPVCVDPM